MVSSATVPVAATDSVNGEAPPQFEQLASVLHLMAEGKLAEATERATDLPPEIAEAVAALAETLNTRFVAAARAISGTVLAGATQLQISHDLVVESQHQTEEFARLSEAAESLASSLEQVARSVNEASSGARQAVEETNTGREQVQKALHAFRRFGSVFAEVEQRIGDLNQRVNQVSSILDVIRRVADQTHLLSLNAAIEAARAGHESRGFAVVAAEVRRLSEHTHEALRDAVRTVEDIRKEATDVAAMAANVGSQVETETAHADAAENALRRIGEIIDESARELTEIADTTAAQTKAVASIAQAIASASASTHRVADSAETVAGAATQLQRQMAGARRNVMSMSLTYTDEDILELSKADHLHWTARLLNMLAGRDQLRPEQILPPEACRLGKLLAGVPAHIRQNPVHQRLTQVHNDIHRVPKAMIIAWNQGDAEQARKLYQEVQALSKDLLTLVEEMQQLLRR